MIILAYYILLCIISALKIKYKYKTFGEKQQIKS